MGYKESLNDFINSQNWIFSRTMADAPHWYCLKAQCESEGAWGWFVRFMDMYGVEGSSLKGCKTGINHYALVDIEDYTCRKATPDEALTLP